MSKTLTIEKTSAVGWTERTVFFSVGGDSYCLPESKARRKLGNGKVDILLSHNLTPITNKRQER